METPDQKIAATAFSVDSVEEIKVGIGRLFESKQTIGERQAVVSHRNLESLGAKVGEPLIMHYDIKLILSMFQTLSGQTLPTLLVRSVSQETLLNEESRAKIVDELS